MNKFSYFLTIWLVGLLFAQPSYAQYVATPPTLDGNITSAEYSNNSFQTATGGLWYMTWDANNLYVAKTGGANAEPTIMYLDLDPMLPVTGGSIVNGQKMGNNDFGVTPTLPFRADVRVYFTDGYVEIRRRVATGNGGWGAPITNNLAVSNTNTNREVRLSWQTLTDGGTIPPSFNWLGYASNQSFGSSNYRYDQAPTNIDALATMGQSTPPMPYYFTVASTANGSATKPFILQSFTYLSNASANSFGGIDVWDFTMDSPGLYISRGTTGGTWTISGSLVVNDGTIFFGSPAGSNFGDTFLGNVRVLGNGTLNMDQTNRPINVREDVNLTGGSQFILSGVQGGDLNVGRNFLVTNGMTSPATFQHNTRTVTFLGNNVAHTIQAINTQTQTNNTYAIPFAYLTLGSPSGTITLGSDIAVGSFVNFSQGILYTGTNYVLLDGAANLGTETLASHITGNVRITQTVGGSGSGSKYFGNIGFSLTPQNSSAARGELTVTRVTGTARPGVGPGNGGNSILRYFVVTSNTASPAGLDLLLTFAYRPDELNNTMESNLALYQSLTGQPGSYSKLTTPSSATASTRTVSYNYQMALASGTYFTLADAVTPLPVTLVSFTAQATPQGAALLRWVTASEVNSKGFGIERQLATGGAWQPVGYVAATNHATGSPYAFTDKSPTAAPASAQVYYRLRQEDLDGTVTYSPVAVIARPAATGSTELVLSPVPVSGASLSLAFAEVGQAGSEVTVSNTQGQRVLHLTTVASTEDALSLPVETLAPGVYIVRVQVAGQGPRYARFVKQ